MGDGYTAAQQAIFEADTSDLINNFFNITPYNEYKNYVNATTLFIASPESGADHPPYNADCVGDDPNCCADTTALSDSLAGTYVNTALDARFCAFNIHRLLVVNTIKVLAEAAAVPDWDKILVVVNDETYGGSGGSVSVASTHVQSVDVAQHEYGHSFANLADEYDASYPGFPVCSDLGDGIACEANVTDQTTAALIKWAPWILAGTPVPTPENDPTYANTVGLFEGARYLTTDMYRSRDTQCLMHFLGVPFCEVCTQEYILKLYTGGWGIPAAGIDLIEPGLENPPPGQVNATIEDIPLSVTLLEPVGGPPLDIQWYINGSVVNGANSETFTFVPSAPGSYQIEISVKDITPLVHPAMAGTTLESTRRWDIEVVQGDLSEPLCVAPFDQSTDWVLVNEVIPGVKNYRATQSISAGPAFTVTSTGCVTFSAGSTIALKSGFRVVKGGRFKASIK